MAQWTIDLAQACASSDERSVGLTGCELEAIVAIALGPAKVERIAAMLRPDVDPSRAARSLKVHVHRLRSKLGRASILTERATYALGASVEVDQLAAVRRFATWSERTIAYGVDAHAQELLAVARRMRAPDQHPWEWFQSHGGFLRSAARDFTLRVARVAGEVGNVDLMLAIATELGREDPCDDEARALVIRAHLVAGRELAAIREYRAYAKNLAEELGVTVPFTFGSLANEVRASALRRPS